MAMQPPTGFPPTDAADPGPSPQESPSGSLDIPRPRSFFSVAGTTVSSILVAAFIGSVLFYSPAARLDTLERPEEDLERLVSREMDMRQVLQEAPAWEREVYRFLAGNEDSLDQAIRWYDDLTKEIESPQAQLYHIMLLAEAGQADRISAAIVPWQYQGEGMVRMLDWVRAAYLKSPTPPATGERLISEVREELSPEWFADTLVARIANGIGDEDTQAEAESAIARRGTMYLNRQRALLIAEVAVLLWGGILGLQVLRNGLRVPIGTASPPSPWNFQDGYALFIRGVLGYLIISGTATYVVPHPTALTAIITLLAGVPLFVWLAKYLAVRGLSMDALGLRLPADFAQLATVTLVLVAVSLVGEIIITVVIALFHIKTDWTDGLLEDLLWDPPWAVLSSAVDSIVWAPLVEEIAFRGVLYGTLRTRMGVGPAALLSAAIFALVHGYGAIGLASVFWSGLIWALAYERTGSLWPATLAHGVNNLIVTAEFVWMYR
jgi:membrane protease YdiL (CAAX protease family)